MIRITPGVVPHDAPDTPCTEATDAQTAAGTGYLPADLAGYYGHEADANHEGSGQTIGFVEFSNYRRGDVTGPNGFQKCFTAPAITGTLAADTIVGSAVRRAAAARSRSPWTSRSPWAPPATPTYQVYKADNNLALGPTMFDKMRTDNVDVVSDSWGLCEVLVPPKLTLTENTTLELLAAGGSSLYVASGDSGSADCKSASAALKFLAIDDPSGQPFATAVGGTSLNTTGPTEIGWKGSGGGVSYQLAAAGISADRDREPEREQSRIVLRRRLAQVPRDARRGDGRGSRARLPHLQPRPRRERRQLGSRRRDERRRAAHGRDHGRRERGGRRATWASRTRSSTTPPATAWSPATSRTSRAGHNSNGTGPFFKAVAGYDMVTGRGSVKGATFAAALAGYVPVPIVFHTTKLTATHPVNLKRVKKGSKVTFSGVLTDTISHQPARQPPGAPRGRERQRARLRRHGQERRWEIVFKVSKRHHRGTRSSWARRTRRARRRRRRTVRIKH